MIDYLADYAYFTSNEDVEYAVRQHKTMTWKGLNDTDRNVLDVIRRDTIRFGATHLKHDTIAHEIEKSNATVRRTIRKLEKLGIIDRIHYIRPVMSGLGANIYVIRPYTSEENGDHFK